MNPGGGIAKQRASKQRRRQGFDPDFATRQNPHLEQTAFEVVRVVVGFFLGNFQIMQVGRGKDHLPLNLVTFTDGLVDGTVRLVGEKIGWEGIVEISLKFHYETKGFKKPIKPEPVP